MLLHGAPRRAQHSSTHLPRATSSRTFCESVALAIKAVAIFLFPEQRMSSSELIKASVYNHFVAQAELTPDVASITAPGRLALSYGRLPLELETVRDCLNGFGLGRNDRVVIVLDN